MTTTFIAYTTRITATIDGSATGLKETDFGASGKAVQLCKARGETSGHDWNPSKYHKVVVKNVVIYDKLDVACLRWFIEVAQKKIDLSKANIAPNAFEELTQMCTELDKKNIKVVKGSRIFIPTFSSMFDSRMSDVITACKKISFTIDSVSI